MRFWQKPSTLVGVLHLTSYYKPLFSSLAAFPCNAGSHLAALLLTSSLFICFYATGPSCAAQTYRYVIQGLRGNHDVCEVISTCPGPTFDLRKTTKSTACSGWSCRTVISGGQIGVSLLGLLLGRVSYPLSWLSEWVIWTSGPELQQKAVMSAAATQPWVQIDVSVYVRFMSYTDRRLWCWCWGGHQYQDNSWTHVWA